MNRREALKTFAIAAATGSAFTHLGVAQHDTFDKYGGWTGKRFEATGFFRTQHDGTRWWFVSPEGNAFLSFAINHIHPGWWRAQHNAETWKEILGVSNVWDSNEFFPALREWCLQVCEEYGFNSIGVHNDLRCMNTPSPKLPYMQPYKLLDIPHFYNEIPDEKFVDVFSQAFEDQSDKLAAEVCAPVRDDPYLLGYSMTDCPLFTEEDCRERTDLIGGKRRVLRSIGFPRRLRNLGADAPGKQVYVRLMHTLYRESIEDFNTTYETRFRSWDALASAVNWKLETELSNSNETRDNVEFLKLVVDRYYKCASEAIHRHDPNHLFVGDKLNANTDAVDTLLKVTTQYTDVLFYQMYARYEVQEWGMNRWSKQIDKPLVNGDAAFTMVSENMPHPFGPIASSLQERIEWGETFFNRAFARPDFIGWHYCGLIDGDNNLPTPGRQWRQHSGMMNSYGVPYPGIKESIKARADQLYKIATGQA